MVQINLLQDKQFEGFFLLLKIVISFKTYMKKLVLLAAALLLGVASFGQQMQDLPNDPEVRVGKLDNGLTYYIRHNELPAQRAEFYLATNAGAIQEGEGQDGLAHFLEHMCFNGTKNFPGKALLDYLQGIGASFGGNINAGTGIEQTSYMLNNIPVTREGIIDTCILIMHDYSHFVLCEPEEIEAERGVIIEEKRTRNTAQWRVFEKSMPVLYGDSKFGRCNLIGSEETLKTFQPEALTSFYHTWYRPDLQAMIVVGDIDVDQVEAKIKTIFADIPAQENPQPKEVIVIPGNEEPRIGIFTDPETSNSSVEIYWRSEPAPKAFNSTAVGLSIDLAKDVISGVMNERFHDIASAPDSPFINAYTGFGSLNDFADALIAGASFKDGEAESAVEALLVELERMKRYGFTDAEVERAKNDILSGYESAAKKKDTRKNAEFIRPIMNHFYENRSYMDPEQKYEIVKMILSQISAPVLNQIAAGVVTKDNISFIYSAPEKEGLVHPTEEGIKAIFAKVENAQIDRGEVEEVPTSFLDPSKLKGSKIKSVEPFVYDSKLITLANGAKVILRPSQLEKNKISINLYKRGGLSLIATEDLPSFEENIWALFMQNCGVAEFSASVLPKMLAGKNVSASVKISDYTHSVVASSTTQDLEIAMQLVYLIYTKGRFDADEYNKGIDQIKAVLPNIVNDPNFALSKRFSQTAYGNNPRRTVINEDIIEKANIQTVERVYKQLFADAAGLTAIISGDFDEEQMIAYAQKYIGSIAKGKKASEWVYQNDGIVSGTIVDDYSMKMLSPKVSVYQTYNVIKPYTVKSKVENVIFSMILDMVYTKTLREEEGGTYGASSWTTVSDQPDARETLSIMYDTNEEQSARLRELTLEGIKNIAEQGPDSEFYNNSVLNLKKMIAEAKITNSYWAGAIQKYVDYGIETVDSYMEAIDNLTPEAIQALAAEYLNSGNFIELVQRAQ